MQKGFAESATCCLMPLVAACEHGLHMCTTVPKTPAQHQSMMSFSIRKASRKRVFAQGAAFMQVGMRVDLELADGSKACGVFIHKKLSDSAGYECKLL